MRWPTGGLWRHREFLRLWAAQIVSAFGSRITRTALPVLAVVVLDQGDGALGALAALQLGPMIAVAMVAGGFVDRGSKRRIMMIADLVRAALVASLPIAAWRGQLTMVHVDIVAAGVGAASALFRIADGAFLPVLIGTELLADGNAKLEATEATAEIAGPALGGVLIGLLGAPLAVLIDAATYLWSAAFLGALRTRETPTALHEPPRLKDDLVTGVRAVFGPPLIRRLVIAEMAIATMGGFFAALYSPYCLRDLQLSTSAFGAVIGVGGIGALMTASIARGLPRRIGVGPTLITGVAICVGAAFLIPAASPGVAIPFLVAHQLLGDGALVLYTVHAVTLRQTLLPHAQLGRANAAILACTMTMMLAAAIVAGALGALVGTRTALVIGPAIGLVGVFVLGPLRNLREIPETALPDP